MAERADSQQHQRAAFPSPTTAGVHQLAEPPGSNVRLSQQFANPVAHVRRRSYSWVGPNNSEEDLNADKCRKIKNRRS